MKVLQKEFLYELQKITTLSEKVNKNNQQKILEMIKEHSEEIDDLYKSKDEHWAVEIADLIILCFEMLVTKNKDIDFIFEKSIPRFHRKLKMLEKQM